MERLSDAAEDMDTSEAFSRSVNAEYVMIGEKTVQGGMILKPRLISATSQQFVNSHRSHKNHKDRVKKFQGQGGN